MNLVQINEHLKDTSIQKLLDYQNGTNPDVPAYMATGELKRREIMNEKQKAIQSAAQGQQPTVKEQVEQKAGLMALQAKQQEMAQQQMAQQSQQQPMPVPPGTPQPPMQEEEKPEFAAASGGIARLPVRDDLFEFGSGGIIAFAAGNEVPVVQETEEEKKRRIEAAMAGPSLNDPLPAEPTADKPLNLQDILTNPAAQKAAMAALTPQQLSQINADRLQARQMAGVQGEYGDEQRKRLAQEEEQYKGMLKDREFNRALAVLSGMGRGGLGGAAPAYLQSQAAEQSADIAQKRRLNELYGNLDAKQREEAMGAATGMTTEQARQRGLAGTVGGQMYSAQTQGLASLETEKERAKNDLARQTLLINSNERIAQMSKDTQEKIAQLDRGLRATLHNTPSATIDTVAVANYVAAGMSPTEAYERVRVLTSGFRGEMTRDQAEDNVRQNMAAGVYMREINDLQKKAKESGVPFDVEAYMKKKVDDRMATSGRSTIGGFGGSKQLPPGFVPDQPGR
jgi:hypothetical protein